MNGNYNLTADQYADAFADFYEMNEETYGDNLEEAYADFEDELQAEVDANQFANYYSETQDLYSDDENGLEEAYADFNSFKEDEDEDEEYSDEDEYDEEEYDEDETEEDEDEDEYSDEDLEFLEFYNDEEVQSIYGDNLEEAYADFMEIKAEEDEYAAEENEGSKSKFHNRNKYLGLVNPTGAIMNKFTKEGKERKRLIAKSKGGSLTDSEKKELRKLNHVRTAGILGGYVGATSGSHLGSKVGGIAGMKAAKDGSMDEKAVKSALGSIAGNVTGSIALGYAGRKAARNVVKNRSLDRYSEEDFDNDFMDFYSEAEDLYEGDIEEAYADFSELMEEEYGIKDVVSKIGTSIKSVGSKVSKAGSKAFDKTQKFIHTHIAEPGSARNAVHHGGSYSDEDETEEDDYSDELSFDEFSDGFAEFYSDNEETYGDSDEDLEEAYDDYSDLIAEEELEFMFSAEDENEEEDREYGFADKVKDMAGNKTAKYAAGGAGLGLAAGLIAGSVGKDAKERKALKAKGAGRTAEETARYNDLKKSRRNKIIGGTMAGAGAGALASTDATQKLAKQAADKVKGFGKKAEKAKVLELQASAEDVNEDKTFSATDTKVAPKEKTFSALDLLGMPSKSFSTGSMDKTYSAKESDVTPKTEKSNSMIKGILGL